MLNLLGKSHVAPQRARARDRTDPLLVLQVEVCPCDFACLAVVDKSCLLLKKVAQSCSLQSAGLCRCPRYATEGVRAHQSPPGHTEWLQSSCWSHLHPGYLLYPAQAHPVQSPRIRQMPAKALAPGNYSACFNTASCCQGKVMALALFFIVRDSQSDSEAGKRCLPWLCSSCLALVSPLAWKCVLMVFRCSPRRSRCRMDLVRCCRHEQV